MRVALSTTMVQSNHNGEKSMSLRFACSMIIVAAQTALSTDVLARGGFGPRGGAYVPRGVPPLYGKPGAGYYGGWRRPYAWPPGGAIAAGAAIGVLTAAEAGYYYSIPAAPADGLCWYYTDDSQTQGFWDVCQ
jgi:hypothetical protein